MKIICPSCEAKYSIIDEKITGKTVKIKCKKCNCIFSVQDGQVRLVPTVSQVSKTDPPQSFEEEDEATRVFSSTPPSQQEWFVHFPDDSQRSMTSEEIQNSLEKGEMDAEVYLWRDGMNDWQQIKDLFEFKHFFSKMSDPPTKPQTAARRSDHEFKGSEDIFGIDKTKEKNIAQSHAEDEHLLGQRNENSVLFSLDSLKNMKSSEVTSSSSTVSSPGTRSKIDEILNLTASSDLSAPMLAPPVLEAPSLGNWSNHSVQSSNPKSTLPPPKKGSGFAGIAIGLGLGIAIAGATIIYFKDKLVSSPSVQPSSTVSITSTAPSVIAPPSSTATNTIPTESASVAVVQTSTLPTSTLQTAKPNVTPATPATAAPIPTLAPPPTVSTAAPPGEKAFDSNAARNALSSASGSAKICKRSDGPTGSGKVKVTFANSGKVTSSVVQGAPFAGTAVGSCVAGVFRAASVPPFDGPPVAVSKSFSIE